MPEVNLLVAVCAVALAVSLPVHAATVQTPQPDDGRSGAQVDASVNHDGAEFALAYNRKTEGGWRIFRRDLQDTREMGATGAENAWVWGVRGARLLLVSNANADGGGKGWRAHRVNGGDDDFVRIHADIVADGFVDLAPDGKTWAAEQRAGAHKRIVLFGEGEAGMRVFGPADAAYDDADPQFSPDGTQLLFRSNRGKTWEIWRSALDGSDAKQLTADAANDAVSPHAYGGEGPARWSPDGQHIVWMRRFPELGFDVWTMRSDGSNARRLTDNGSASDAYPSWSPDGKRIAFDSDRDGNNEIYLMQADGSDQLRVTITPQNELAPVWVQVARE